MGVGRIKMTPGKGASEDLELFPIRGSLSIMQHGQGAMMVKCFRFLRAIH